MTTFAPTKPRRPVYASYTNPGPYYKMNPLLGDKGHDKNSLFPKRPAYYIGLRTQRRMITDTPGPCYLLDNPLVYRDGMKSTPKYSIKSRRDDHNVDKTPAPGDYDVIKCTLSGAVYPSQPRCIFGKSSFRRVPDDTPAPNAYTLPPVLTHTVDASKIQAPIYSMRAKFVFGHPYEDFSETPGPAAYKAANLDMINKKAPGFTMRPWTSLPTDNTNKPGPGAHRNEIVWDSKKKTAPSFTFGIHHSQYLTPLMDQCIDLA
ncbi:outer dense fiber protein 3-B-like [Octopus sinensis]|uniref:Outer dense fiber protein 3-B-like n=1 Tax=Octopus sinensis TaxID=2607531 RepID=A0A6P7T8B4_9MOLL|nr:outer dense fiber protein 3-B-like [Octopus sinensis]